LEKLRRANPSEENLPISTVSADLLFGEPILFRQDLVRAVVHALMSSSDAEGI
jgi:hypothetical protein